MTDKLTSGVAACEKISFAAWSRIFLAALADTSHVGTAAAKANVSTEDAYKARRTNKAFAAKWYKALEEGYDNLEMELLHRLRNGIVADKDGNKFDNVAALRLLIAQREALRSKAPAEAADSSDEALREINERLGRMRKQALAAGKDVWAVPGDDG